MSRRRINKIRHQRGRQQLIEFLSYNETTPEPNVTREPFAISDNDEHSEESNWENLHNAEDDHIGTIEQHLVLVNAKVN